MAKDKVGVRSEEHRTKGQGEGEDVDGCWWSVGGRRLEAGGYGRQNEAVVEKFYDSPL